MQGHALHLLLDQPWSTGFCSKPTGGQVKNALAKGMGRQTNAGAVGCGVVGYWGGQCEKPMQSLRRSLLEGGVGTIRRFYTGY